MPINAPLILIIDDEQAILQTLQAALEDEGYRVHTLDDGKKALDVVGTLIPDLILLDICMPNCNGIDVLTNIKKEFPQQSVIIISGYGNIPVAIDAIKKGARDFIEKPLNLDEILSKIEFLKHAPATTTLSQYKPSLSQYGIMGESSLFFELINQANRLAPHTFPVIIYGEYGTGKTTLARYIHKKSPYAQKDFCVVDCTDTQNFTEKLVSAFVVTNGTVYLQHVEQLSREHQQILVRTLKTHTDAHRIIASACKPLFNLLREERFDATLFYELNKAPLEIPPLRKRSYDIPLLLNHYCTQANTLYKKSIVLNAQSIRILRNYTWPGNVTELKNTCAQIVVASDTPNTVVTPEHLVSLMGETKTQLIEEQTFTTFSSLSTATNAFEKNFLLYLLKKSYYNTEHISQRLNMSHTQLKNKLLELNIELKR